MARQIAEPGDATALDQIAAVRELRAQLEAYEGRCVAAARKDKATWDDIGSAAGVRRQNANRKWGSRV